MEKCRNDEGYSLVIPINQRFVVFFKYLIYLLKEKKRH